MSDVIEIKTKDEWFEFIKSPSNVTDFGRRNGCVPCKRLEPHFEMAAGKVEGTSFAKVMLDEIDSEFLGYVMDNLNILATPTILYYHHGTGGNTIVGRTAPALIKEVSEIANG